MMREIMGCLGIALTGFVCLYAIGAGAAWVYGL